MRILALLLSLFAASTYAALAARLPNLVFIIADDCTYLDMEAYGGQAKTPHMMKLAGQGMKFSRCFQTAPMCSPTRHNIYTGLYPVRSGAWPNHTCVYTGTKSIAHFLKDAAYRVALSGKTHIAPKESFPFEYSKDFRGADPNKSNPYPAIDRLMRESKENGNPFCLFACSNEPHSPYTKGDASAYPPESLKLPPSWVDTPQTRKAYSEYLAEITYYDQQCGALLNMLNEHGIAENTLVIVTSEQGSGFPFAKWTCFELGLTSAMIARWPGKIAPGSKTDALVEYVDIAPTFLDIVRSTAPDIKLAPETEKLDGKSFLPVLLGKSTEHKPYTFGIHTTRGIINGSEAFGIRSCGTKTHRYIRNLHPEIKFRNVVTRKEGDKAPFWMSWIKKAEGGDNHAAAMTRKYTVRPSEELYDVADDPHCLKNLIDDPNLADLKATLSSQLDGWMKAQGDQGRDTEAIAHTRKRGYKAAAAKK
jgi:N-sulfoglucosamine sulfohydrolase